VHALKKDERNLSTYGHLIEDNQGILNSLQRWQVNHVSHNLNGAAHRLTSEALYLRDEQCFLEETPNVYWILFMLSAALNWFYL
jgi:hypothetical protein